MLTREIPAVTKNLLIINSIMFIATWVTENMGIDLTGLLGLHFFLAPDFHLYQIFTYMFMHGGLGHIFMNMFMLWMFGPVMEAYWGSRKFFFLLHHLRLGRRLLPGAGTVWTVLHHLQ